MGKGEPGKQVIDIMNKFQGTGVPWSSQRKDSIKKKINQKHLTREIENLEDEAEILSRCKSI